MPLFGSLIHSLRCYHTMKALGDRLASGISPEALAEDFHATHPQEALFGSERQRKQVRAALVMAPYHLELEHNDALRRFAQAIHVTVDPAQWPGYVAAQKQEAQLREDLTPSAMPAAPPRKPRL